MINAENEVSLFDVRLPLSVPVRRTLATPFPGKVTFGDFSRDDEVIKSSWVISGVTGGLGKRFGEYPQDDDRYDFGNLEARYAKRITLGQQVERIADLDLPIDAMIDYNERLYLMKGTTLYRLEAETNTLTAISSPGWPQPTARATDIAVYFGKMWVLTTNELIEYNVGGGEQWITHSVGGVALIGWDDKLFRMANDGKLYWIPGTPQFPLTWNEAGQLPLPAGYADQLVVYFDMTGEPIIYAVTKVGLWAYDFDQKKFFPTGAKWPPVVNSGKRTQQWRDELYVPTGAEEMKYNAQTFQPTGPNRDDGLPEYLRGDIARIVPGHAFRYAMINGKDLFELDPLVPEETLFTGDGLEQLGHTYITARNSQGAILATPGTAWHCIHIEDQVGDGWGWAHVATIEGRHRLFFSSPDVLYAVDSPTSLHNPLQNPTTVFKDAGFLETPWFDAGFAEMDKLAVAMNVSALNVTPNRFVRILAAWDDNDIFEPVATITEPGFQDVTLGPSFAKGRLFKNCRFRIEMATDDPDETPILRSAILKFTREPDKKWVYNVDVAIVEKFGMMTDKDLRRVLEEIAENKYLGELRYRRNTGEEVTALVKVSAAQFVDHTGDDARGRCILSLLEMD